MQSIIRPGRARLAAALPLVGAVALAACTGAAAGSSSSAIDATDTGAPQDPVVVTTVDYAFEGLPSQLEVGDRLQLQNASERELHELVAVRLPDDEERPVEELITSGMDVLMSVPPTMVLAAPPGGEQVSIIGDGTFTEPGRYAVVCVIPTGVDPEVYLEAAAQSDEGPPTIPNAGPPHIAHGMHAEVIVE